MDQISLGSAPYEENCAQLGSEGYLELASLELKHLKRMMIEIWPPPKGSRAYYKVISNSHDYGVYYELEAFYDENDEAACNWAFETEEKFPKYWDEPAKQEIDAFKAKKGFARIFAQRDNK